MAVGLLAEPLSESLSMVAAGLRSRSTYELAIHPTKSLRSTQCFLHLVIFGMFYLIAAQQDGENGGILSNLAPCYARMDKLERRESLHPVNAGDVSTLLYITQVLEGSRKTSLLRPCEPALIIVAGVVRSRLG
ncbi:hypothetical protein BJX99DRAFT_225485 [Aspergillus californicus]